MSKRVKSKRDSWKVQSFGTIERSFVDAVSREGHIWTPHGYVVSEDRDDPEARMKLDRDAVHRAIRAQIECAGSLRALARRWDVTPGHISRILNFKKAPGPLILRQLGLRQIEAYEPAVPKDSTREAR